MKDIKQILSVMAIAIGCQQGSGAECAGDSILSRMIEHDLPVTELSGLTWENPVFKQWQWQSSLSEVGVSYGHEKQSAAVNPQNGRGGHLWGFEADSYMKYKTSTLWGQAAYSNGRIREKSWCEAVDLDIIYPYYPADERGGSMNVEEYSFAGGYGDHTDKWAWGATLGYDAGLYYRPVDPRPKDVTGKLEIAAGGAYTIGKYRVGLGLDFMKYKQSVSISFVSEMGEDKIYHTTGMGTHYVRFAGTGATTYYNGYSYGAKISMLPVSTNGLRATVGVSRLTFNAILSDLNKLPLCGAWHNSLQLQAGYVTAGWGVSAGWEIYKRHGHENVFGDASGNIYPQIGSTDTYADNGYTANVEGAWQKYVSGKINLHASASMVYNHRCEVYYEPGRQSIYNRAGGRIGAGFSAILPHGWCVSASVGWEGIAPVNNDLIMRETQSSSSVPQLIEIERTRHYFATLHSSSVSADAGITRTVAGKYAVQLSGKFGYTTYSGASRQRTHHAAISFIF